MTTTSSSIDEVFRKAEATAKSLYLKETNETKQEPSKPLNIMDHTLIAIVFDEIGLAEIAPENPLKILHPLLEPQKREFAFIGLSNWMLDQSKMNRVVYVSRPDMDVADLIDTCQIESFKGRFKPAINNRLPALARAYFELRKQELGDSKGHQNFYGSRDFYEMVKIVKRNLKLLDNVTTFEKMNYNQLVDCLIFLNAIQRSFSGKYIGGKMSHETMASLYKQQLSGTEITEIPLLPSIDLIYQNLMDTSSRHLMVLTQSSTLEEILISQITEFEKTFRKKDVSMIEVLTQSKGRDDMISVVMSKLPVFIKNGYTIIMKNLHEVYGCMYDLLNQNYSKRQEGGARECDLFYDNTKHRVTVHPDFKCIILMDRQDNTEKKLDLEKRQQPPFLNRFREVPYSRTGLHP